MTKKYDIISLNNHLYMVDKEVCPQIGDISIHGNITRENHVIAKVEHEMESLRKVMIQAEEKITKIKGVVIPPTKVLASTDTTLGLPLLPKVEEDIVELGSRYANGRPKGAFTEALEAFVQGYKAASAKKEILSVEVEIDENNQPKLNDNQVIVKSWIFRKFVE